MVADDTLMSKCATAHCACKMAAMLTHETSKLTGSDLRPSNRMIFRKSAVIMLLCYFTYLHELNLDFYTYYVLII